MSSLPSYLTAPWEASAEQKEALSYAIDSCDQIAAHFNDLIESTRLDTGKLQIRKKPERVETMLRRSVISVLPTIEAKNITLVQTVDDALPELEVDSSRIVQVLSNLLSNALKYTDSGGRIDVTSELVRGRQFWVTLPAEPAAAMTDQGDDGSPKSSKR